MKKIIILITIISLFVTAGCTAKKETSKAPQESREITNDTVSNQYNDQKEVSPESIRIKNGTPAKEKLEKPIATIETNKGKIFLQLYPQYAPKTVANFIKLSKDGFYKGLTFHRVEPGFVIQGGDPEGNGTGGPGYTIPAEFNELKHKKGTLAMARSQDPDSAGSQFYITLDETPHLDGNYTVFGYVTKGMDVVEKIAVGDKMNKISIKE